MNINAITNEPTKEANFKGIYKLSGVNVDKIKDKKEQEAATECLINAVILGANMAVDNVKVSTENDIPSTYFKIDDKNDAKFESTFKQIVDECNKMFNTNLASKIYIQKVNAEEYNKAQNI